MMNFYRVVISTKKTKWTSSIRVCFGATDATINLSGQSPLRLIGATQIWALCRHNKPNRQLRCLLGLFWCYPDLNWGLGIQSPTS